MKNALSGKVALITGGSRGIGAAVALKLAEHGADVAITYLNAEEKANEVSRTIDAAGSRSLVLHADGNSPATMPNLVDRVIEKFGRLDILVNNAGVFEGVGSLVGDVAEEAFEHVLNVNLKSVFTLTQAAAKVMADDGRIINVSSVLGFRAIFPGVSAYTMSKFGVNGLTRAWAWDLAARGITVNSVEPGPIRTGMGDPNAAHLTAMKRLGEPEEVASVIAFIASPEASYMTGSTVRVDGGVNA
jgi:3-oxoacyl-[acyl-carrier protein] reductase